MKIELYDIRYIVKTRAGETFYARTLKEIAERFDVSESSVAKMRRGEYSALSRKVASIESASDEAISRRPFKLLKTRLARTQPLTVNMLDYNTHEVLQSFTSVADAVKAVAGSSGARSAIYKCARGAQKSYKGYKWEIIACDELKRPKEPFFTDKVVKYVLTYQDKEYRFATHQEIADYLNVTMSVVDGTIRGASTYLTNEGIFIYTLDEYEGLSPVREHRLASTPGKQGRKRRVHMLDRYTHEILDTFDSITDAAEDVSVASPAHISRACRFGGTIAGYKWEYAE